MFNVQQVLSAVRWAFATFGPLLVSHGYVGSSTLEMVSGALVSLIPLVWGLFAHTQAAAVATVDAIAKEVGSPVAGVVTANNPAGVALAASLPGPQTVPAGTMAAAQLAK